jgi:hypothetical protein
MSHFLWNWLQPIIQCSQKKMLMGWKIIGCEISCLFETMFLNLLEQSTNKIEWNILLRGYVYVWKQNNEAHQTLHKKGGEERGGNENMMEGKNLFNVHCTQLRNYHNETYGVLMYTNSKYKTIKKFFFHKCFNTN